MTVLATGICDELKADPNLEILDTYDRKTPQEQFVELRRKALHVDLFFSSTNAVTELGQLVNLDMIGNRVSAITFGPKHVVIFVGRNKIVSDLDEAMYRIKNYVAPTNAMRLNMKTPCVETSYCEDCKSPNRICNTWGITEKSFPKGRVKIVLINEDLGL
ncbi:MAG: lactate utilization protein [Pseudomonadota bacterium]